MPSIAAPATVLVTVGANGGTVRSPSKGDYLSKVFKDYGEGFVYYVVEDMIKPGAFHDAVKGVQAVIHTASPAVADIDDPQDLIQPALGGTLELINGINICGSEVKRLVLTSSGSAITDPTKPAGTIYADDDWNTWSIKQVEEKGRDAGWDKYRASKVLAEQAAWEEAKKQNRWDMVAIHPLITLGPIIHDVSEASKLNTSIARLYNILSAKEEDLNSEVLSVPDLNFGDVRDVALAHLRAVEYEKAGSERFIVCNGAYTWQDALDTLPVQYCRPLGMPGSGKSVKHTVFDSTKAQKMLDLSLRSFKETINDTAFELHSRGWLLIRSESAQSPAAKPDIPSLQDCEGQNSQTMWGKPQNRLAADRLGEELHPDSTIWQLYQEESKDHDKSLVEDRDKSLDVLLIYAGLFSSILAGFVMDSKNLLQQDTAAISLDILLILARSQQFLSSNSSQPGPPIEYPSFTPMPSARLINILWFLALVISLSTALMAMLAKEWLHNFISHTPASPHAHALLHQERLRALKDAHALGIIDSLPTVLHLALLLFSVGLVIYLGQLDYIVTAPVAIFLIGTFLICAKTTHLGSVKEFHPFVTPVSRYFYRKKFPNWETRADDMSRETRDKDKTTFRELRALDWLANHARDPAIKKCVYQALAGLRAPKIAVNSSEDEMPEYHKLLSDMYDTALSRLSDFSFTKDPRFSTRRCVSISKHISAFPRLARLLNATKGPNRTTKKQGRIIDGHTDGCHSSLTVQTSQSSTSSSELVKKTLDHITKLWDPETRTPPYLTADAHSLIVRAKLLLIKDLIKALDLESEKNKDETIQKTRRHYSRALFRTGIQLTSYSNNRVNISAPVLCDLLTTLKETFESDTLCPDGGPMSTNYYPNPPKSTTNPQNSAPEASQLDQITLWTTIAGSSGTIHVRPTRIGDVDGLVVGLLQIIGRHGIRESYEVAIAARDALHVVARKLLLQWLATMKASNPAEVEVVANELDQLLRKWEPSRGEPRSMEPYSQSNITTIRDLLMLAQIGAMCAGCVGSYMSNLSFEALRALCQISKKPSGRVEFTELMTSTDSPPVYHDTIKDIAAQIIKNHESALFGQEMIDQFLRLLFPEPVEHPRRERQKDLDVLVCTHKECYFQILELWCLYSGTGLTKEFQRFMKEFEDRCLCQSPLASLCTLGDNTSDDNINRLLEVGDKNQYTSTLVGYFMTWIKAAFDYEHVKQSSKWVPWPKNCSFRHFRNVVAFVLKHDPPKYLQQPFLASFLNASIIYIRSSPEQIPKDEIQSILNQLCDDSIIHCIENSILSREWAKYFKGITPGASTSTVSTEDLNSPKTAILERITDVRAEILASHEKKYGSL
ncbi:Putative uncharacterized oxidoreductase YDR541C [Saccharomyces cerevisiae S288c] [Rhizoctonia solani]|uniref:Uncharacterized oxidoreductase YDR541C [Saccharomyces cerevisiae S288c] n=1 Tax=Rhizoctonia solani TaxID=456999 RepID=A0A0K6GEL9_9AGAM|nr:Putative uncharacterized oxidoreductase YDR541C [Saccharomyces cerevisiae S288c] [Rhizoctonia solani]